MVHKGRAQMREPQALPADYSAEEHKKGMHKFREDCILL